VILGGAAAYDAAAAHARLVTGPISAFPGGSASSLIGELGGIVQASGPSLTFALHRREDFLSLRVDGWNLRRHGNHLVRKSSGDAYLVFTFQPQHVYEQAYPAAGNGPWAWNHHTGHAKALLAYPSRIAFKLNPGQAIPLTLEGLLDWSQLTQSLTPTAAYNPDSGSIFILPAIANPGHGSTHPISHPGPPPRLAGPRPTETAIELPWRLAISPTAAGGSWSHPLGLRTANNFTELWHTRLADSSSEAATDGGQFRAIWNYDTNGNGRPTMNASSPPAKVNSPFVASLEAYDRWEIVTATSNFKKAGRADAQANKLWLSARGGFIDSVGNWDSTDFDLSQWKHLATLGRDQYVKTSYKGFLFPFGHRAMFITVTFRVFEVGDDGITAALRQIYYVVVREPTVSYVQGDPGTYGIANDSRNFPYRYLTIKTLRSPNVTTPDFLSSNTGFSAPPFVPTLVSGTPFNWHFVGTDWNGQTSEFTAPAVFVFQQDGFNGANCNTLRANWNTLNLTQSGKYKNLPVGAFTGETVAFAEPHKPGDTNMSVQQMRFGASAGSGPISGGIQAAWKKNDLPIFYPSLYQAEVSLNAAAQATGGTAPAPTTTVNYNETFVGVGFNASGATKNLGNLYLEIAANPPGLNFAGGSSGGVITPNISALTGISRSLGPVADTLENVLGGNFDPTNIFDGALNATILGGVKLIDLIEAVLGGGINGDNPIAQAMQLGFSVADAVGGGSAADERRALDAPRQPPAVPPVPTTQTSHFHWAPDIVPDNPIVTPINGAAASTVTFVLDGTVTANLVNPKASTFSLLGTLSNFAVNLMEANGDASFITINFNDLKFTAGTGQKSHVSVDIQNVQFDGCLKFIEQLESFMDFSGDGGPKITVDGNGVTADLSVALPDIGVGVFSLSNISIDAGFNLPFSGAPARFRFSFATQDNPFTLSVAIFGGGGFFGIAIGTDGVELIQASFDFGAMASIDLGVASGSVQLVAGIYFSYGEQNGTPPTTCILTGFVKLDGSLSILDLITLTLTFDLSLTYENSGGVSTVTGTATLSVGIKILFFSFSVSVTATKTFGGGNDGTNVATLHSHRSQIGTPDGPGVGPPSFADQMPQSVWQNQYCPAFAS
jgi:hypothetical protein